VEIMLNFVGTLALGATIAMVLVGVASTTLTSLRSRLALAAIAGAWVAVVVGVTGAGALNMPSFGALFAAPIVVVVLLCAAVPAMRSALLAIPAPLVIGLNTERVLGVLFLALLAVGRLDGPFPWFAGIGDIVTGIFALSIARIAARESVLDRRVLAWNAFGALDLIVAVVLGVMSLPGSPLHLIHAGVGSAALVTLPWALIPLFLVPLYLIGHGIIFAQAYRQARSERRGAGTVARGTTAGTIAQGA
jgi:hypothetical protein